MRFFRIPFNSDEEGGTTEGRSNRLQKYIHAQSVQDMSRLASEISPEVRQIIGSNVQALLGYLPPAEFNTSIMASKENFQNLLASAMLTGYFMHAMETRMHMDEMFEKEPNAEPDSEINTNISTIPGTDTETQTLQHPGELFGGSELMPDSLDAFVEPPSTVAPLTADALDAFNETHFETEVFDDDGGRFLSARELAAQTEGSESSDKLNIQLEINTRMNRAELARLLKELREFQGQEQPEPRQENSQPLEPLDGDDSEN